MRITFEEEIEAHKAFSHKMKCSKCGDTHYSIHYQILPSTIKKWWIMCDRCKHEIEPQKTRDEALECWRNE